MADTLILHSPPPPNLTDLFERMVLIRLFETMMEEQDVDIMAWAMGTLPVPECYVGTLITDLKKLNYVPIAR